MGCPKEPSGGCRLTESPHVVSSVPFSPRIQPGGHTLAKVGVSPCLSRHVGSRREKLKRVLSVQTKEKHHALQRVCILVESETAGRSVVRSVGSAESCAEAETRKTLIRGGTCHDPKQKSRETPRGVVGGLGERDGRRPPVESQPRGGKVPGSRWEHP